MDGEQAQTIGGRAVDRARFLEGHIRAFERLFGSADIQGDLRVFFAPGRVNLMGAHLDYNGGPVMPTAIDRGTLIAVATRRDRKVRLRSVSEPGEFEVDLDADRPRRRGRWVDYPVGVLAGMLERSSERPGVDVLFGGNLPVGAGLSSSASICVGFAFALDQVWELGLSPLERVALALDAEREFVGVRCGIMDPYAVGLAQRGSLLWLDCMDSSFEHLPLDPDLSIVVADTGVRRELAQGDFNQRVSVAAEAFELLRPHHRQASCLREIPLAVFEPLRDSLEDVPRRRAQHVLEEVERTFRARECLLNGDVGGFGSAMAESHRSLRDLYDVSVPELDCLVDSAMSQPGVLGARLTGAGFGGCAVILAQTIMSERLAEAVATDFERRFAHRPKIEIFAGDEGPREY